MRSLFHGRTTLRACLLVIPLFAAGVSATDAQQLAPSRFEAAVEPADAPRLERIVIGTAIGGVLGGAAGALAGAGIGSLEGESDGFISAAEAFGVMGLALGYTVGSAVGARRAATRDGARPALAPLVLISVIGAGAGGVVWNRVGEGLESQHSMRSWYMGAAAGVATHLLITSIGARQRTPAPQPPTPAPGPPEG